MSSVDRPSVGVAVIIWRGGKAIFYKRRGSHGENMWSVPGGHLEFGESWEECAKREALEEIGVTLKNIRYLATTNDIFESDNKHYISIWVEADLDQGEPRSMEPDKVVDVQWHSIQALPSPLFEPCWTNLKKSKPELFAPNPSQQR